MGGESTGSLPPGGCGLTALHWNQLRAQRSVTSMGELYRLLFYFLAKGEEKDGREG